VLGRAWLTLANAERCTRLVLATAAGVRELLIRETAQPYVLLFILAALGLPDALRLLASAIKQP
jgi:hypothetical protein